MDHISVSVRPNDELVYVSLFRLIVLFVYIQTTPEKCAEEVKCDTATDDKAKSDSTPVKVKPISMTVFYKGKEMTKHEADHLAANMAAEKKKDKEKDNTGK